MKRRAIISILIVLALCVGVFAACATQFDDDTLKVAITNLERDMLSTTQTPQSYPLSRVIENSYDAKGNLATIYVKWTIEDSNLITISDDGDKTVTVNIPAERAADIPYKLRATLVDEKGTAYEKADGQYYTTVSSRVAPKSNGDGGGGGQGGGGGTTTTGDGTQANPYTPSQANEVGEALASNAYTATAVYVRGYVVAHNDYNDKATPFKGGEGDWRFYIADDVNGTGAFFVNYATPQVTITELNPGDLVTVYGYIENFNGAQMYGKTNPPKPVITAYTAGSGGGQGGGGGTTTGQGTEASPYTVADALAVIQSLPQGEQSTQLSYVQGKITGEIKTGDHNELLFTITDNGTGDGITVWYAPAVQCQTGDTVVVKGYLWNFYNQTNSSSTAEIADNDDGVGLAIVKVNGQAPSGGGQGGSDVGTPSTDWTKHIGTYTLYFADEEFYYTNMPITVDIQADKIIITDNEGNTEITDIEYYTDAVFGDFVSDDFYFTWKGEECTLSIYQDDGSLELYGETFIYVTGGQSDIGTPSDDWSDYAGEIYELITYDEAGSQDTITITINATSIVITHGNDVQTISSDIDYYTEATDESGYTLDWFGFTWDGKVCYLDIYSDGGFVQFYDEDDTLYYYCQTSGGDVGGGETSDDWSKYIGSYVLQGSDLETEEDIPGDTITIEVKADGIVITKGTSVTTISSEELEFYLGEEDLGGYSYDGFYFMIGDSEYCLAFYTELEYIDYGDLAGEECYYYTLDVNGSSSGGSQGGGGGTTTTGTETIDLATYATEHEWTVSKQDQEVMYPTVETEIVTMTVTATASENSTTGVATSGSWWGTQWRLYGSENAVLTVTGKSGYTIKTIKLTYTGNNKGPATLTVGSATYGSGDVIAIEGNSIVINITNGQARITKIEITYSQDGGTTPGGGGGQGGGGSGEVVVPEGALLFDFEKNFSSYSSDWTGATTYGERTVSSASLGIQSTVEFVLSNAGAQINTISTMPVLASKEGAPQYVTVNGNGAKIKSVTFNLKEWLPGGGSTAYKKFTKVQIEYQIGDGAWTVVDGVGFSGEAQRITDHQTLSSGTLPEGVTSVRLVYVSYTDATTKGNQQMGLKSIVLELAE